MTYRCICPICEELREGFLAATQRHMASLIRIDQATATDAIGDLELTLGGDRSRLDEAARAFQAHRQLHAGAAERKARFNGLSIVARTSPRSEAKPALSIVPRRGQTWPLPKVRPLPYRDDRHEEDDSPLPPLVA